jgi:hypothetical protein
MRYLRRQKTEVAARIPRLHDRATAAPPCELAGLRPVDGADGPWNGFCDGGANMKKLVVLAFSVLLAGCGSVTPLDNDGAASGAGGGPGSGGAGVGGHGTGTGGARGSGGETGTGGMGQGGSEGLGGRAGSGGKTGSGGREGGTGGYNAGTGGKAGTDGAGGVTACQTIAALDHSCTVDADCFAGRRIINCCGTARVVGLRVADKATFDQLEPQCDASYPACGCAMGATTTDDGSVMKLNGNAGVACVQGTCTTFVAECGHPCATGTTCFSCVTHLTTFAACTTACTTSNDCHDPSLPLCQLGTSGNVSGQYCTSTGIACDTK